ncbi:MAG TPA: hypothetical protein VIJ82_21950 [Streptosporangiaceae bacterium]|jgi:hypothetical protein
MISRAAVAILSAAAAAALSACGSSAVTIHGQIMPGGGATSITGGLVTSYAFCSEDSPSPGSQVAVTDPDGKIIGSATLGTWSHRSATASGLTMYPCMMPFMIRNVAAEQRYGFEINGVPGKIWVSNVSRPVLLQVGSGG